MKKLIIKKYEKKLIFIFVAIIIGLFFLIYSKNKFWNYTKEFSMDNAVLLESNQTVIQEISGKILVLRDFLFYLELMEEIILEAYR